MCIQCGVCFVLHCSDAWFFVIVLLHKLQVNVGPGLLSMSPALMSNRPDHQGRSGGRGREKSIDSSCWVATAGWGATICTSVGLPRWCRPNCEKAVAFGLREHSPPVHHRNDGMRGSHFALSCSGKPPEGGSDHCSEVETTRNDHSWKGWSPRKRPKEPGQ